MADHSELSGAPLFDALTLLVSRASAAIIEVRDSLTARRKADESPVTQADEAAERIILAGLADLLPGIPVVSEEAGYTEATLGATFLLVDPLDGTREIIAGRDEFTVNVAIVRDGVPMLGIVSAPAQGVIWRGILGQGAERLRIAVGEGVADASERTPIRARPQPAIRPVVIASRSHLDPATAAFIAKIPTAETISCGSSVKFCRIAEGAADLYPRFSTTCEWDIAAGHAVLSAAGGAVTTPDGDRLQYGKVASAFRVPGFVARGEGAA